MPPFKVAQIEVDGDHHWGVATGECDLTSDDDPLLLAISSLVREAYGEDELLAAVQEALLIEVDPAVAEAFDLAGIRASFRLGLPDPEAERTKPGALRSYRSEAAEFVARRALADAFSILIPTHPQRGKVNSNQPFLGFDGWGLMDTSGFFVLVLIQVKGTDQRACPPAEAHKLAAECAAIPRDIGKLARALSVMAVNLRNTPFLLPLAKMLAGLRQMNLPPMVVAPVVVRGLTLGDIGDLSPIREAVDSYNPAGTRALAVTIGVNLTEFGKRIMDMARAA
jgi:hypothetical protein